MLGRAAEPGQHVGAQEGLVARGRGQRQDLRGVRGQGLLLGREAGAVEHEEIPDLPTVMEELRRTRQAAPVRQSQDWEEVASKLGYSAPEQET